MEEELGGPDEARQVEELKRLLEHSGTPCSLFPSHGISLLAGASGVGKTALYAGWLRVLLEGGEILGRPAVLPIGKKIGVIIADRGLANNRHWFERERVVGDPRVSFYSIVDDPGFDAAKLRFAPQHPTLFARCLDMLSLPEDSFVVVDPFSLFAGSKLNDYSATAAALIPLQRLLKKRKLTCLGVHHTSKMKADPKQAYKRPQDQILGSMALAGYTDTQFYIKGPEETNRPFYLVGYVSHTEPAKRFMLNRDKEGRFRQGDIEEVKRAELEENGLIGILRLVSKDGSAAMLVLQQAQGLGWNKGRTNRALGKLIEVGAVVKDGHGRYRRVVHVPGAAEGEAAGE